MTTTIALAGKGGTGKTTIACMVIKYLLRHRPGTILAIDADPSSNLHMVLGMDLEWTIGEIREEMLQQVQSSVAVGAGVLPGGMSKREYLDYEVRSSLVEGDRVDLIAMGRPEGPGCYCAVNHLLRQIVDGISRHYDFVVIDNEAGMEHLSRRTTRDVDYLLIVSDPTQRGIVAAERIAELGKELDIHINHTYLVLNRLVGPIPPPLQARIEALGIPLLGVVPADNQVTTFEFSGRPLIEMEDDSPVYQAVAAMMAQILGPVT